MGQLKQTRDEGQREWMRVMRDVLNCDDKTRESVVEHEGRSKYNRSLMRVIIFLVEGFRIRDNL